MYLSKNSRCAIRKTTTWFPTNFLERRFSESICRWRARWPEDDPTKPPLRLNIPKDVGMMCPYGSDINSVEAGDKSEALLPRQWLKSTLEEGTTRGRSGGANEDDGKRTTTSSHVLDDGRSSPGKLDSQNLLSKSLASISANPRGSSDAIGNRSRKTDKNFKLRKIRSRSSGVRVDGRRTSSGVATTTAAASAAAPDDGNGIVTIQIALNEDGDEDRRVVKGLSEVEAKDITSDEQIRALAEAIVRELRPKDAEAENSSQSQDDDAYLVIINVTDRPSSHGDPFETDPTPGRSGSKAKKASWIEEVHSNAPYTLPEDEIQVRDLEFCGDMDQVLLKRKKPSASHPRRASGRLSREYGVSTQSGSSSMSRKGRSRIEKFDQSIKETQDLVRLSRRGRTLGESRRYLDNIRKERRENSQRNPRRPRSGWSDGTFLNMTSWVGRMRNFRARVKTLSDIALAKREPARVLLHYSPPEREMQTRTKFMPGNYLEKKVEKLGEESFIPAFILKPLAKQITFLEEAPELLNYPDFRWSPSRRTGEARSPGSKWRTMRGYHNSCAKHGKLTKGVAGGPPPVIATEADPKRGIGWSWKPKGSTCAGEGDSFSAILSPDRALLTKQFRSNLDVLRKSSKLLDLKGSNAVYLQGGKAIDDTAPTEAKKGESDGAKGREADGHVQCASTEESAPGVGGAPPTPPGPSVDAVDERSEFDIADVAARIGKAPNESKDRNKKERTTTLDEKRMTIREIVEEKFEMNEDCLRGPATVAMEGYGTYCEGSEVGDSLLSSKKDVIINVTKNVMPKMSDNIVNLANESLAQGKGASSLDSLSMMKRVKEIVELDLKNAEKIFVEDPERADSDGGATHRAEEVAPDVATVMASLNSVVAYDEASNRFYVRQEELEYALKARREELLAEQVSGGADQTVAQADGDFTNVPQAPGRVRFVLKKGDSVLVYDERTKSWKVDFTLLEKGEEGHAEEEEEGEVIPTPAMDPSTGTSRRDPPRRQAVAPATPQQLNFPNAGKPEEAPKKPDKPGEKIKLSDGALKNRKELDAMEIRRQNSNLYDDVFIEIKKSEKAKKEGEDGGEDREPGKGPKKGEGAEKAPPERYVSDNIVQKSTTPGDTGKKLRTNRVETVKLNISPTMRPPSKVMEINLNKKAEDGKGKDESGGGEKGDAGPRKPEQSNGRFYKKFEKYKTPFSDPEYEDKPMKINTDMESNPNLKKLDSCNKTLVLQEISKSPDGGENWVKDETDKMAGLLLKVLQEAAEGNSRRRGSAKLTARGNPYEAIRKKQETNSAKAKKKEPGKRRAPPFQTRATVRLTVEGRKLQKSPTKAGQFPTIEDESHVEVITPDALLPKEKSRSGAVALAPASEITDDIPGPTFLKKLTAFWNFIPAISCQATVFVMIRMFQLAKASLSLLSPDFRRIRDDPFGRLFAKYGPVVKVQGPLTGDVVLINRPEDITTVFEQASVSRSVFDSVESCRVRSRHTFPLGITDSCSGTGWDVIRKSAIDVSDKGCLQYFAMLKNADEQFLNRIRVMRNNQNQVPDDFVQEIKRWSMEGLCCFLFERSLGFLEMKNLQVHWVSESERLLRHLGEATDYLCQCESHFQVWRFVNTPAMSGLSQAYQSLDLIISKYVHQADVMLRRRRKALANNSPNESKQLSFLESVLLNDRMTPDEIAANVIDIMLIGANTTTVALSFVLYNIAQNSRVQKELFRELKNLLPSKDSQLNYHQLHSLKYLQACLKESLRLHIPVPFVMRVLPSDIALSSYRVPGGTHVVMDTQTCCMKEQIFDDPELFKPERWLEQDYVHPFTTIPFCNGPRSGLAKRLTEIQLWTCIAKIIRNYRLEYHFGEVKGTGKVISYPDRPLRLAFIERDE